MARASRAAAMLLSASVLLSPRLGQAQLGEGTWSHPFVTVHETITPLETSGGPSDPSANPGLDLFYLYLDQATGMNRLEGRPIDWPYIEAGLAPTQTVDTGLIFSLGNTVPKPGGDGSVMAYVRREVADPFPSNVWVVDTSGGFSTTKVVSDTLTANYFDVDTALTSEGIVVSGYNTDQFRIDLFLSQDGGESYQLVSTVSDPSFITGPIFGGVRQRVGGDPQDPVVCGTYEQNGTGHIFGYELNLAVPSTPAQTSLVTIAPPATTDPRPVEAILTRLEGECWGAANARGQLVTWRFTGGTRTLLTGPAMGDTGVALFEWNDVINVVTPEHHVQIDTTLPLTMTVNAPPGAATGSIAGMGRELGTNVYLPIVLKGGSVVLAEFGTEPAIPVFGRGTLLIAALVLLLTAGLRLRRRRID